MADNSNTSMSERGHKGGKAQGKENNPANFANRRDTASKAGKKGGAQ